MSAILPGVYRIIPGEDIAIPIKTKGYVYEDLNRNDKKEKKEPGLAYIPFSNGRDVVLTDLGGLYRLPVDNDDILFVIKPAGYKLPVDRRNLPQFYYRHKPQGSPKLKYTGTAPTGGLPASVDFFLIIFEEII